MKRTFKISIKIKNMIITLVCSAFLMSPLVAAQTLSSSDYSMTQTTSSMGTNEVSVYDLLIITPDQYQNVLQPLVIHKQNVGVKTRLVTLSEVYEQMYWHGRDKPEKIKYFIKTAHEEWEIKYVMLVGDFTSMPIRYCYNADNNSGYFEPCFISELYYADLYDKNGNFSSWDTNNNGVFGEWFGATAEDYGIDLYPDVYVGRLACANEKEVSTMVNKIITYETTAYGEDWFKRLVTVAGDTYPQSLNPNWTGNEGEVTAQAVIDNMTGFEPTNLWTSDGSLTGPKDVIGAIDKGCGFLFFEGHANPSRWCTHPTNDSSTWVYGLSVWEMMKLKNKEMLPICIVGGCHNNEFDVTPLNIIKGLKEEGFKYFSMKHIPANMSFWKYTWIQECWGWKLASISKGGSIATIGCSGLGMSKEDKQSFSGAGDYMDPQFFYEYGKNGTDILGQAWGNSITNYLNKYPINWSTPAAHDFAIDAKTVQQWVLFGDPSLKIGGYSTGLVN